MHSWHAWSHQGHPYYDSVGCTLLKTLEYNIGFYSLNGASGYLQMIVDKTSMVMK